MIDKELIEKMLVGIREELEKARTFTIGFERGIEETTRPLDDFPTFEPTDEMTITIKINKPDDNDRQDRRAETLGIDPVLIRRCQNAQAG